MNVHVRFFTASALVALATLAATGTCLSAQGAPFGSDTSAAAVATVGVVSPALVGMAGGASQTSAASTATPASEAAARGPSLSSARVASHAISKARGAPPVIQDNKSNKNSVALMIVGGAALVVGAVIGDDAGTLVMLGGAAVGLWGLYLFLT